MEGYVRSAGSVTTRVRHLSRGGRHTPPLRPSILSYPYTILHEIDRLVGDVSPARGRRSIALTGSGPSHLMRPTPRLYATACLDASRSFDLRARHEPRQERYPSGRAGAPRRPPADPAPRPRGGHLGLDGVERRREPFDRLHLRLLAPLLQPQSQDPEHGHQDHDDQINHLSLLPLVFPDVLRAVPATEPDGSPEQSGPLAPGPHQRRTLRPTNRR